MCVNVWCVWMWCVCVDVCVDGSDHRCVCVDGSDHWCVCVWMGLIFLCGLGAVNWRSYLSLTLLMTTVWVKYKRCASMPYTHIHASHYTHIPHTYLTHNTYLQTLQISHINFWYTTTLHIHTSHIHTSHITFIHITHSRTSHITHSHTSHILTHVIGPRHRIRKGSHTHSRP